MSKNNGLSVIVPVYQTEKYLDRCIKSILNQSFTNLEVILVDDGSLDNSPQICDKYQSLDKRIKVIHKKNGGLSSARNDGIKHTTNEYITFVDSDDWISSDIYEIAMNFFNRQDDIDIVDFQCEFVKEYKNYENNVEISEQMIIGSNNILIDYLYRGQYEKAPFSVCKKIYKKELFNNIEFPIGKQNEDILTNFNLLGKARKLIHLNKVGYFYFQNNYSITNGKFKIKDEDLLYICKEILNISKEKNDKKLIELSEIKLYRSYFSLLSKIAIYGFNEKIPNIKEIEKKYIKELRNGYFKLIKSKMPLNRKVIMSMFCINYPITKLIINKLKGR